MSNKIKLSKGIIIGPDGRPHDVTTLQIINSALDAPVEGGLSVKDFRSRAKIDRIIERLPQDATELELGDDELETLKKAVESTKWISRAGVIKELIATLFPEPEIEEAEVVTDLHAV